MTSHLITFFFFPIALLLVHGYNAIDGLEFSYSGNNNGPDKWGSLSPAYVKCRTGNTQSPVNIVVDQVVINKSLPPLSTNYSPVNNATLINHKYTIEIIMKMIMIMQLRLGEAGKFKLNGKEYILSQMHWHTPSEHKINGLQYAAECHMVHLAADGSRAVIGILYNIGNADPLLSKIHNKLAELGKKKDAVVDVGKFEPNNLGDKYYRYMGSLTTPPCLEDVTWTIMAKVKTISKEQINILDEPLDTTCKSNNRLSKKNEVNSQTSQDVVEVTREEDTQTNQVEAEDTKANVEDTKTDGEGNKCKNLEIQIDDNKDKNL
ncbi:alpha carbonic anhydrase 1, chloroplastic-like [Impatiens glandulifera]|uniref:alpha carbonic anhydrase 1, chloroplastic-like n=1 Tax=Impatiens glandulifera TaxID=253017 RepID=UPI001FB19B97|nr:alpha carbonic anhydrase 1, chloroplastic-like [Impatiens glandulifera]